VTTELEMPNCLAASAKFRHSATLAKMRIDANWFIVFSGADRPTGFGRNTAAWGGKKP
jgi:hypothetical protein